MWQIAKRFFVFQGKALEFKLQDVESRRAIRRAYREGGAYSRFFSAARVHARMIVLVLACGAVVIAE